MTTLTSPKVDCQVEKEKPGCIAVIVPLGIADTEYVLRNMVDRLTDIINGHAGAEDFLPFIRDGLRELHRAHWRKRVDEERVRKESETVAFAGIRRKLRREARSIKRVIQGAIRGEL